MGVSLRSQPGQPAAVQTSIFDDDSSKYTPVEEPAAPLAARMRPRTLDEFVGQQHFLGPGKLLRRMLEADRLTSVIFYGPPGTGKTSLAQIIARQTRSKFERLSGVESNVADMRRVLAAAANRLDNTGQPTIPPKQAKTLRPAKAKPLLTLKVAALGFLLSLPDYFRYRRIQRM